MGAINDENNVCKPHSSIYHYLLSVLKISKMFSRCSTPTRGIHSNERQEQKLKHLYIVPICAREFYLAS